jgi:hypothetical protein
MDPRFGTCAARGVTVVLIELDPKYLDIAVIRWQDFTGREAILNGDGWTFAEVAEQRVCGSK